MYQERVKALIKKGIIGFAIGAVFMLGMGEDVGSIVLMGIFFTGLPYGWQLSGKVVGGWVAIGGLAFMFMALLARVLIAMLIGGIAYPIALIYNIVKAVQEKKQLTA